MTIIEALRETPPLRREPSITELQLLSNIGRIKSNAEKAGMTDVVEIINKFNSSAALSEKSPIDSIDQLTACISYAFRLTPKDLQKTVFARYAKAEEYGEGMGYAPKAEIETFCTQIEPKILALVL